MRAACVAIGKGQEVPVEQDGLQHFGLESTMEQVEPGNDGDINNQVEKCLISRGSQWHAASQKQLSSSWRQNTAPGTEPGIELEQRFELEFQLREGNWIFFF